MSELTLKSDHTSAHIATRHSLDLTILHSKLSLFPPCITLLTSSLDIVVLTTVVMDLTPTTTTVVRRKNTKEKTRISSRLLKRLRQIRRMVSFQPACHRTTLLACQWLCQVQLWTWWHHHLSSTTINIWCRAKSFELASRLLSLHVWCLLFTSCIALRAQRSRLFGFPPCSGSSCCTYDVSSFCLVLRVLVLFHDGFLRWWAWLEGMGLVIRIVVIPWGFCDEWV